MKRRHAVMVVAGLLLLAFLGARHLRSSAAGSAAAVETPSTVLAIPVEAALKNPITTEKVRRARLATDLQIVGSVSYDQNHYAVVGPLVSGRIAGLRAGVGDSVRPGQILAEVESAEVGQAQAAFLSASARAGAADANLRRERELAAQRISSEREREVAEAQAVSEAAEVRAAIERLRAFGVGPAEIEALKRGGGTGGRVPLRAPLRGTVVARSITLGQAVERATDAFEIVDLDHLWILLDLYEKDLRRVAVGQKVELRTEAYPGELFRAAVAYVNPLIDEKTRTAGVRLQLGGTGGKLRPGQFVTAHLLADAQPIEALAVSRQAVQTVEGKSVVFVRAGGGFERRLVEVGQSGGELVELQKGVNEGEEVATNGAFLLKSELLR